MSHPPHDLTPLPDLLHSGALAGPVRTRRPVYGDLLPPCNAGCPAGERRWATYEEMAARGPDRFPGGIDSSVRAATTEDEPGTMGPADEP